MPSHYKPVLSWWMILLRHWQRHGLALILCSSGLLVVPAATQRFIQPNPVPLVTVEQQQVSRLDYERLKVGMTLTDAQATLGRAIELSRNETTATYTWANVDGSAITAMFKDDRLVSKQQLRLK